MLVTRDDLINNFSVSGNVSLFVNFIVDKRALVVDRDIVGLSAIAVKDFYDVVILETKDALLSVPVPDFIVHKPDSPYNNFILNYDELFVNDDSVLVSNFNCVNMFGKLARPLDAFNVNYLPSGSGIGATPSSERGVTCGLNSSAPGVHFAKIMGCSEIYYTGVSSDSINVGYSDILAFTTATTRLSLANLIYVDRPTLLNSSI